MRKKETRRNQNHLKEVSLDNKGETTGTKEGTSRDIGTKVLLSSSVVLAVLVIGVYLLLVLASQEEKKG